MARRYDLQEMLEGVLGSRNVYYQPPSNVQMKYPCIVYSLIGVDATHANDSLYGSRTKYSITIIDKNPDSILPDKIARLPLASFGAHFTKDNLNHTVYNMYF